MFTFISVSPLFCVFCAERFILYPAFHCVFLWMTQHGWLFLRQMTLKWQTTPHWLITDSGLLPGFADSRLLNLTLTLDAYPLWILHLFVYYSVFPFSDFCQYCGFNKHLVFTCISLCGLSSQLPENLLTETSYDVGAMKSFCITTYSYKIECGFVAICQNEPL